MLNQTQETLKIESISTLEKERLPAYIIDFQDIRNVDADKVGGKNLNLALLTQAGLPVPKGFAITTDAYQEYLQTDNLPEQLVSTVVALKHHLGGKIALRSSANVEDGEELSMAGVFETYYLDENSTEQDIQRALNEIYSQARSPQVKEFLSLHGKTETDVLMGVAVQELIKPDLAGVIYTGVNGSDNLIQYVAGFGNQLVDGENQGITLLVDPTTSVIKSSLNYSRLPISQTTLEQLNNHTTSIIELTSSDTQQNPQDIEFAVKDGVPYILQTRPLNLNLENIDLTETPADTLETARAQLLELIAYDKEHFGLPHSIFETGNFHELLPHPKEMDFGIFAYIFTGSDGIPGGIQIGRLLMGYSLAMETLNYTRFIAGKPYTDSAMAIANYYLGFPQPKTEYYPTLGLEYANAMHDRKNTGYGHMDVYLQNPTLEQLESRFNGKGEQYLQIANSFNQNLAYYARTYKDEYLTTHLPEANNFIEQMTQVDLSTLDNQQLVEYATTVLEHLRTSSCLDFVIAARLGFYYTATARTMIQRLLNENTDGADQIFAALNQGLSNSAITQANIEIASAATDEEAFSIARDLVGHFSTQEMLEIRHPLLSQEPQKLADYVTGIRSSDYVNKVTSQRQKQLEAKEKYLALVPQESKDEFEQVIDAAHTYMGLRETIKYNFSKEYALIKNALELLESRLELNPGDIYSIFPRELPAFVDNPQNHLHLIKARQQSFANYSQLDFPAIIYGEDVPNLSLIHESEEVFTQAQGKFLSPGEKLEGLIINLDEFASLDQALSILEQFKNQQQSSVIICAQQMNLSHDPLIAKADGLILHNAGIASHGAQRARELGKGALGGVNTKLLHTGMKVSFDPSTMTVIKLDENENN